MTPHREDPPTHRVGQPPQPNKAGGSASVTTAAAFGQRFVEAAGRQGTLPRRGPILPDLLCLETSSATSTWDPRWRGTAVQIITAREERHQSVRVERPFKWLHVHRPPTGPAANGDRLHLQRPHHPDWRASCRLSATTRARKGLPAPDPLTVEQQANNSPGWGQIENRASSSQCRNTVVGGEHELVLGASPSRGCGGVVVAAGPKRPGSLTV